MAWEGKYGLDENMFILLYHVRKDVEYKNFERNILLNNDFFYDFFLLDNDTAVYVFNFDSFAKDYNFIKRGKYSFISNANKKQNIVFLQIT